MLQRRIQSLAGMMVLLGCMPRTGGSVSSDIVGVEPTPPATVEAEPRPSALAPASAAAKPLHAGRVVISERADPSWATGPELRFEANDYHVHWHIERLANLDVLPLELRRYAGMSIDLYGRSGRVCTAVLEDLTLEAYIWMEDVGGHEAKPGADAVWEGLSGMTDNAVLLVASFAEDPRCDGALWARDASLPAPRVLVPDDVREHYDLLTAEHRRVLESDAGKALSRDFEAYAADPDYAEDAELLSEFLQGQRKAWIDERGDARVVITNFGYHGFAPCRWQGPVYGVVRSLAGEGEDLFAKDAAGSPPPAAVFDADLDGRWELLFIHDNGEFNRASLHSESDILQMSIALPDQSWVWC